MDYEALWQELTTDPAGVGYADPAVPANDAGNAGAINDANQQIARTTIAPDELLEAVELDELAGLEPVAQQFWMALYQGPAINIEVGTGGRDALAALFPAGSTTRANLVALVQEQETTSRAAILGLGRVYVADIETARERYG